MYLWLLVAVVLLVGLVLGSSMGRIADHVRTILRLAKEPKAPYS
jgi:hypothetical protein